MHHDQTARAHELTELTPPAAVAAGATCTNCSASIASSYYEANGQVICARCRALLQRESGTGVGRFGRAIGLGLLAAIGGSAIYYGIAAATGYEFSLVAILVGFMVGRAVFIGSRRRGGRKYQLLAVALTYFAIVSTYIPFILQAANSATTGMEAEGIPADLEGEAIADLELADPPTAEVAAADEMPAEAALAPTLTGAAVAIVLLILFAAAAPILAGLSNIIGMVIIAIGLFEAWRQTQRVELTISGPYRLGAPPAAGANA